MPDLLAMIGFTSIANGDASKQGAKAYVRARRELDVEVQTWGRVISGMASSSASALLSIICNERDGTQVNGGRIVRTR